MGGHEGKTEGKLIPSGQLIRKLTESSGGLKSLSVPAKEEVEEDERRSEHQTVRPAAP